MFFWFTHQKLDCHEIFGATLGIGGAIALIAPWLRAWFPFRKNALNSWE